jgi:hypothetical protein
LDHKNTFSLYITREQTKRSNHYHTEDIKSIFEQLNIKLITANLEDNNFDYNVGPDIDQTRGNAQAQILFIGEKL